MKKVDYFKERKDINNIFSPQIEIFVSGAQYDDPSRLNMSAKQILQSVISKKCEIPFLISKNYKNLSEINSPFQEIAEDDGIILYNKNNLFIFYYTNQKKLITRYLSKYKKLVNLSISLKYVTDKTHFKKGDILWAYTNIDLENSLPKIGYRAKIAYMPFFGYNADDAVIISESFAKKTEIEYSLKVYVPVLKTWKYIKKYYDPKLNKSFCFPKLNTVLDDEDLINYYHIDTEDHFAADLYNLKDTKIENASKFKIHKIEGIKNGKIEDIKVHLNIKNNIFKDKNIWEVSDEEIDKFFEEKKNEYVFQDIISEIKEIVKNKLQVIKELQQKYKEFGIPENLIKEILDNQIPQYLMLQKLPTKFKELFPTLDLNDIDFVLEYEIGIVKKTTRGDKFTNLHAGKATVAMIIPDDLMIKDPETGKPIDVIFNTLGIPGRNNWGTIFESLLSLIIESVEKSSNKKDYKTLKEKIQFINENFISKFDKKYYQEIKKNLIDNFEEIQEQLVKDINSKGFYLFVPNFLLNEKNEPINYAEIEKFAENFAKKFKDINLDKSEIIISKELIQWLRDKWNFKDPLVHAFKDFKVHAQIANNYLLKLHHVSNSKYNAINFTTSYNKITGQPVRGRKKKGGQHISWQSLAALLAHKENNAVLKELYTIKSDSIKAKKEFIMKYLTNGEYYLNHKYNSITKKTINNALKIFGMKFDDTE